MSNQIATEQTKACFVVSGKIFIHAQDGPKIASLNDPWTHYFATDRVEFESHPLVSLDNPSTYVDDSPHIDDMIHEDAPVIHVEIDSGLNKHAKISRQRNNENVEGEDVTEIRAPESIVFGQFTVDGTVLTKTLDHLGEMRMKKRVSSCSRFRQFTKILLQIE